MKEYSLTPKSKNVTPVSFEKQTPELLVFRDEWDQLYEKAYLSPEIENDCEYCRNTTAWD